MKGAGAWPSCCASRASLFCRRADLTPPRRPKITSGKPSTGRAGKAPCPGSCVPPRASLDCGATGTVPKRRVKSWPRCTTGSPKGSRRPISKRQNCCSMVYGSRDANTSVSLLLRFRFVQALAASPKYLRLFECLCRGLCPSFEASYSERPDAPVTLPSQGEPAPHIAESHYQRFDIGVAVQ